MSDVFGFRLRIGVARFSDGWNVVVERNGQPEVYDPAFATEAEAQSQARELAATLRRRIEGEN